MFYQLTKFHCLVVFNSWGCRNQDSIQQTKITNLNKIWICLHSSKSLQRMKFSNKNTIIQVASWFTSSNIYINWSHVRVKRKFLMILGGVFYTAGSTSSMYVWNESSHDLGSGFLQGIEQYMCCNSSLIRLWHHKFRN